MVHHLAPSRLQRILNHLGEQAEPPRIAPCLRQAGDARAADEGRWTGVQAAPDWGVLAQPQPEYPFDQQVQ